MRGGSNLNPSSYAFVLVDPLLSLRMLFRHRAESIAMQRGPPGSRVLLGRDVKEIRWKPSGHLILAAGRQSVSCLCPSQMANPGELLHPALFGVKLDLSDELDRGSHWVKLPLGHYQAMLPTGHTAVSHATFPRRFNESRSVVLFRSVWTMVATRRRVIHTQSSHIND